METLCDICRSIAWDDIPPFPEELYDRIPSGHNYFQYLHRKPKIRLDEPLGIRHHGSLETLRHAAAQGCGLCVLVEHQVDGLLSELETLGQPRRYYDNVQPQFDFWLIKRPDGSDGVWVLTNSAWQPGQWAVVVAAVAFCAEEDDPLATVFSGRVVEETPSEGALNQVDRWVVSCDDEHSGCEHQGKEMPTRVIDVGFSEVKDVVKLMETSVETQQRYIALSYCWGIGKKGYVTTKANLTQRKDNGFETMGLPKTIRDAIELARRLNIRYLWVDGLCICQDDTADWDRESRMMGMVYANAYLTISATGVDDSEGGLFFPRTPRKTLKLPFTACHITGTVVMSALPLNKEYYKKFHVEMFNEPLTDRAWCFQERMLSRRILHFTTSQIYFECLQGTLGEDGLTLPYRSIHIGKEANVISEPGERPPRNTTDILSQWGDLIYRYGVRKLTYAPDKLPALSAIAEIHQQLLDDEYVAGLWKGSILEGLCWTSPTSPQSPGLMGAEYRAPSWSWAAADGFSRHGLKRPWTPMAVIKDSHVVLDGANPFGKIKDAWIKLSAPLTPLDPSSAEVFGVSLGEVVVHCADGDKEPMRISFDTIDISDDAALESIRSMELYSLGLARVTPPHPSDADHDVSLIVTPVDNERMKRVGYTKHRYTRELGEMKDLTLV